MRRKIFGFAAATLFTVLGGAAPLAHAGPWDIVSGETVTGNLPTPTTVNGWRFDAAEGERVLFNFDLGGPKGMNWKIRDYDGVVVTESGAGVCAYNLDFVPPVPGTQPYWLEVSYDCTEGSGYFGNYALTMLNIDLAAIGDEDGRVIAPAETATGMSLAASDMDAYQFHGRYGERVVVKAAPYAGAFGMKLYVDKANPAPAKYTPIKSGCGGRQELVLPENTEGLYTLVVYPCGVAAQGGYDLTFYRVPGPYFNLGAVTDNDGGNINGAAPGAPLLIDQPSDVDMYHFYVKSGDAAYLSSTSSYVSPVFTVYTHVFGAPSVPGCVGVTSCWITPGAEEDMYTVLVEDGAGIGAMGEYSIGLGTYTPDPDHGIRPWGPSAGAEIANIYDTYVNPLAWAFVPDADDYEVQFGEEIVFGYTTVGNGTVQVSTTVAGYPLASLPVAANKTYYWRVNALNYDGVNSWNIEGPVSWFRVACNPAVSITPASLEFGSVLVGTEAPVQSVTINNTGTCYLNPVTSTFPGNFPYSHDEPTACSGGTGGYLAPGQSCTVSVSFTPTAAVDYPGSFRIDGLSPVDADGQGITLHGVGVLPDLRVSALNNPPVTPSGTGTFDVTETTRNDGLGAAGASITRYRLSSDQTITTADRALWFTGYRDVGPLSPGAEDAGAAASVTVPWDIAAGSYYLGACADNGDAVVESDEANNCRASGTTILVQPDLRVNSVIPTAPDAAGAFSATDWTTSLGVGMAPASTTTYRLSLDSTITAADTAVGTRSVPPLNGSGWTDSGSTSLTVPNNLPTGTYYVGASADGPEAISESDETNNSVASGGTMNVQRDLQVYTLTDPVLNGEHYDFSVRVRNVGSPVPATVPAGASTTGFRLTLDDRITRIDPVIAEVLAAPQLDAGAYSATDPVSVSIPPDTPAGSYRVAACADINTDAGQVHGVVPESNEDNNCKLSKDGYYILFQPDLVVDAFTGPGPFTDPISTVSPGFTFTVNDTTRNSGKSASNPTTTRFRLSLNRSFDATDPVLAATRPVPALEIGQISTGMTTVTIPTSLAQGEWYLGVCADDTKAVLETDEANNCSFSDYAVDVQKGDLRVDSVSNAPVSGGYPGSTFTVTDTTTNYGAVGIGASATKYLLATTSTAVTGIALTGTRDVPALAAAGNSMDDATVTFPSAVAPASYYLVACADGKSAIPESAETNNCKNSGVQNIQVGAPDLQLALETEPPAAKSPGSSFEIRDTTTNIGSLPAVASTTRYRLSKDQVKQSSDPLLTGTRLVPARAAGSGSTGKVTVTIPAATVPDSYYVIACADDANAVKETDETNNCDVSNQTILVMGASKPDLVVTAVSDPPANTDGGLSFEVTDTTENTGELRSWASNTSYRLSLDATITASDPLLTGTRPVPALDRPGDPLPSSSQGTITVTIPATVAANTYYLGACADHTNTNVESNETNNCKSSVTRIVVRKPDLVVLDASDPNKVEVDVGGTFEVGDTTSNSGTGAAGASTTSYRLSLDTTITSSDPLLTGTHAVPGLAANGGSAIASNVTVTVPATVAQGTYYLGACADSANAVSESSEANNCTCTTPLSSAEMHKCAATAATIDVISPDLTVTNVTYDAGDKVVGGSFGVTDTTKNIGLAATKAAATTRYRLSLDANITSTDPLLTGTRQVPFAPVTGQPPPSLAAGASSTPDTPVTVTIPVTVTRGQYNFAACADDTNAVKEVNETNNCLVSGSFWVGNPDLEISVLDHAMPPTGSAGTSFTVSETTKNRSDAEAAAGRSTTRYRLSTDSDITSTDPLLTGTRTVPATGTLAIGASYPTVPTPVTVTIPATVPQGVYHLAACADDANALAEMDEYNNCRVSTSTIDLRNPDLVISFLSHTMPPEGLAGTPFDVTDTTRNDGTVQAGVSTTRYRLTLDTTVNSSDPLLTNGTRRVPAEPDASLAANGGVSTGTVTVSIPATVAQGTYFLAACADDLNNAVKESNETNNCRLSAEQIFVQGPDLQVTSVQDPPASGDWHGTSTAFTVAARTVNRGLVTTDSLVSPVTRFRLSLDATINSSDPLLTGERAVGTLAPEEYDATAVTLSIPGTVPAGLYFLGACADETKLVTESDETNNCGVSQNRIEVLAADLATSSSYVPPTGGLPGLVLTGVIYTTSNSGPGWAKPSVASYYLSLDTTITTSDRLIGQTKTTPAYDIGEIGPAGSVSSGPVSVTVPTSTPVGTYYFAICADHTKLVPESNETNNCWVSASPLVIGKPDLVVSSVSASVAGATAGYGAFDVTDTTKNNNAREAGASMTRHYLSLDRTLDGFDPLLTGDRAVPSLGAGEESIGTVSVSIPSGVSEGAYWLFACADGAGNIIVESDEMNNCTFSAATLQVSKPDLTYTIQWGDPDVPQEVVPGQSFVLVGFAFNGGGGTAGASTAQFRLSPDTTITSADTLLTGSQSMAALVPGANEQHATTVTIPVDMAAGTYYLAGCADDLLAVMESDEGNNCGLWTATVTVRRADIVVTDLSSPPSSAFAAYTAFTVNDTTRNDGPYAAEASTTVYRLSTDPVPSPTNPGPTDPVLSGELTVPALAGGASFAGQTIVSIPFATPPGTYYLFASADARHDVDEEDENNNRRASATPMVVLAHRADLSVSSLTVPSQVDAGIGFSVSDYTRNTSTYLSAGASTTRHYLSVDNSIGPEDTPLSNSRSVPSLAASGVSDGTVTVTVPFSASVGTYRIIACADDDGVVLEIDDTNNCTTSTTQVQVRKSDLVAEIYSPVPTFVSPGASFMLYGRTQNIGTGAAGPTSTRFRLSSDTTIDASDWLLEGSDAVPTLAGVATRDFGSGAGVGVTVPAVPEGVYYFAACADDAEVVGETVESNNCFIGGMTEINWADLFVTNVGGQPVAIPLNASFTVEDTTVNQGGANGYAFATANEYRLSYDILIDANDRLINGSRAVPELVYGGSSTGSATVSLPTDVAPGFYYLGVCADAAAAVPERSETNNCAASYQMIEIKAPVPDLRISWLGNVPVTARPNVPFNVDDTISNIAALASSPSSAISYFASSDPLLDAGDPQLEGFRSVPALPPQSGGSGTGVVTFLGHIVPGAYFIFACADGTNEISELDETNNCAMSTDPILLSGEPDLEATFDFGFWGAPPYLFPGFNQYLMTWVSNLGNVWAPATTTRFRISTDLTITAADRLLDGQQDTPDLGSGQFAWDQADFTVPVSSPPAEGEYYLAVCADDFPGAVTESVESNNCTLMSTETKLWLRWAALTVSAISNPPATIARGGSFNVTDTTANSAAFGGNAVAFVNSYYLSTDTTINTGDRLLTGTRSIPGIGYGSGDIGSTTVTVPTGTPTGYYYLGVCADTGNAVPEANNSNNCKASTARVQVQ